MELKEEEWNGITYIHICMHGHGACVYVRTGDIGPHAVDTHHSNQEYECYKYYITLPLL